MNIDKVYEDFTTSIAPKIAEGLVITKDYFIDLFGRYIKYLIVTDIMKIALFLTISTILIIIGIKFAKQSFKADDYSDDKFFHFMGAIVSIGIGTFFLFSSFEKTEDLIKAIYIPEVRVVEELNSVKNNLNQ